MMLTKHGFTFKLGKKDIFIETAYKNKTKNLAKRILKILELPENLDTVKELLYWMQKASLDVKCTKDGRKYFDIYGNGFGGKGSFVDDGLTEIYFIG